jgi:hypothetical protein
MKRLFPRTFRRALADRKTIFLVLCLLAFIPSIRSQASQSGESGQPQDQEFSRLVKAWTTKPEFISPLVDHLPTSPAVPNPSQVLGHHIGAPKTLTYYADILNYYRTLASKSPRIKVMNIGKTDEGRDCTVIFAASEEAIRNLESNRQLLARLADPRGLTEAEAMQIIAQAKPVYHLMGGLHARETGAPEMLMELAYRLAVDESPLIRQIRDNLIVSITPVADPDGRDRYVDWYYRHLVDSESDSAGPGWSPFWGKYVFHDNNRDINFSQPSNRALLDWYLQWHPPVMHDLHESIPYLYTMSLRQNPMLDPVVYSELQWFSNFEMTQLNKYGMPGVWARPFADMWSPAYLVYMSSNHNGIQRVYEVFGNGGATTMNRKLVQVPGGPDPETSQQWYRPVPPYSEAPWSIRNNINYSQTGVLTALQLASGFPKVLLDNFYHKSRNSIEAGTKHPPHGYVIPAGQRDTTRVKLLTDLLQMQGIEVGSTAQPASIAGKTYPQGSLVVKLNQPYGRLARFLLTRQVLDPNQTFDDTGWSMGLMTNTQVDEIADKSILDIQVEKIKPGAFNGSLLGGAAKSYAVAHNGSNQMIALRYQLKEFAVKAAEKPFKIGETEFPAGSFLIAVDGDAAYQRVKSAVESLGLQGAANPPANTPAHDIELPRLAVYSTWGNTQDAGWVRYALDKFGAAYDLIYKERVRQGGLRGAYDVIVVPNHGGTGRRLVYDIETGDKPAAYTRTDRFKFMGAYGQSDDIRGGMGLEGVLELRKFVDEGGVLITLGGASFFPTEFGLAGRITSSRPSSQFYAPGSAVEADIQAAADPIFYGYAGKTVPVRYANGPLLDVPEAEKSSRVLMRYSSSDQVVLSGLMKNSSEIKGRPAIVDVPLGKGRILLYATNPVFRWQNHGEFNLLFNAILNFNDR